MHPPDRSPRLLLLGVWMGFVALLVTAVLAGAELGLRVRRDWIAARLQVTPQGDSRFVADRMLRYTNRPSFAYESPGPDGSVIHYTNNSLGLRGPEITRTKPPGVRRVVIVGGSTIYGALDDDSVTLSQQLEAILRQEVGPNVQVVNAGVPGYVALGEVALVCAELLNLQPDVVIDVDGLNDIFYGWPTT